MEVPALQERPELFAHLHHVWRCFWQVSNARSKDGWGGAGGIPLTEIESLMRIWRISEWEAQIDFVEMLKALDHEYLTVAQEQQEAKQPNKPASEVSH